MKEALVVAGSLGGLYLAGACVTAFKLRHAHKKASELFWLAAVWPILVIALVCWKP